MTLFLFSCGKNSDGIISDSEMILIPGGQFMMGSSDSISFPDEYPPHEVTITAFLMDRYEVTNKQFLEFVNSTGYVTTAERIFKYVDVLSGDSISRKGSLIFDASELTYDSSAELLFQNGFKSKISASFKKHLGFSSVIHGENGTIILTDTWTGGDIILKTKKNNDQVIKHDQNKNVYALQIKEISQTLLVGWRRIIL